MESYVELVNISHFNSIVCSVIMVKRVQQESGEERVTAKSRPMMNLTARMPSVVSSSTSSNPGRTSYGYQDPGKSVASDDRSGKPEKPSNFVMGSGQILWNVIPICETSQIYYLMGKRPMKDVLWNHLKDRLFHLVHWLSITL